MEISKNNNILNQDLIEEKRTFKLKTYKYFHTMLDMLKESSLITLYIFHFIEIIQLISFAFSPPHELSWNIDQKKFKILFLVLSGFRLTPLFYFGPLRVYGVFLYTFFVF